MKIKLTLNYDGTDFNGWQVQPNLVTVQSTVEDAVFSLTGERVRVTGSGRTDAGVHAIGQVASFSVKTTAIPPENYARALNIYLPPNVKVTESVQVDEKFDAIRNAKKKTYIYKMYRSFCELPTLDRFSLCINPNVDANKMREGAKYFLGEHDFKAFSATGGGALTSFREIYSAEIEENGIEIYFKVTGNGFLYNMVRIMVGTLLRVGEGKMSSTVIKRMLESGDRTLGGKTVPPKGLTLLSVEYE